MAALDEAEAVLAGIEAEFRARGHRFGRARLPRDPAAPRAASRRSREVADTLFRAQRSRTLVGLS